MNCQCTCCRDPADHLVCGCCEGTAPATPVEPANRPGLGRLAYRVGTHSRFLDSMLSRLSSADLPQLRQLSVRDPADSGIALLDACATLADVLTFYQERIANEGYLGTAIHRRSIMELANLTGYRLRPGVAASVYLAYTLEDSFDDEARIPAGSSVQSIPAPGEDSQTFETAEDLTARAGWNTLKPRLNQPQTQASILALSHMDSVPAHPRVYLKGITNQLRKNDHLLLQFGDETPTLHRVHDVVPDPRADRTLVWLSETPQSPAGPLADETGLVAALTRRRSVQPRHGSTLGRAISREFATHSQAGYTALKAFAPQLAGTLATAAANARLRPSSDIKVYALRRQASVFGHNTAKRTVIGEDGLVTLWDSHGNWPVFERPAILLSSMSSSSHPGTVFHEEEEGNVIYLDAQYDGVLPGSWIVVQTQPGTLTEGSPVVAQAVSVEHGMTRSEYGMTGPTTRVEWRSSSQWILFTDAHGELKTPDFARDFDAIRQTRVFAESEALELADEPVDDPICARPGEELAIELDGFYDGLESGRWVIVSGERDIEGTSGVMASELAMLASVEHRSRPDLPGDSLHTVIRFAEPLEYCFKRDTVRIYGNVVKATHGETQEELAGNGDARKAFQKFDLKQAPLTFVSAPTPAGADSTLAVWVNDLRWHETDSLAGLAATDRRFVTRTDEEDRTSLVFGDGRHGARLPSGTANVRAQYRYGIGRDGNVKADQISLLKSKPLGVREVVNPLPASGGADRESRDQARRNIPLAVRALDRLVSVRDYQDFARVYAGVGEAVATEISDGQRQVVHVTIAGADDIPIDESSDLYRNLYQALGAFGDPCQPVRLAVRERVMLVLQARVKIDPDYRWESVSRELRDLLLDRFGFAARELGEDVYLSEILSVMHQVPGVVFVDADAFGGIPEKTEMPVTDPVTGDERFERRYLAPEQINGWVRRLLGESPGAGGTIGEAANGLVEGNGARAPAQPLQRLPVNLAGRSAGETLIHPAQIACFAPEAPSTLVLNGID
ncbi:MAG: putative baseplate assembly protein [Xanthomonadales bacterium]|nr:putative baseplate assembly protein [Xanthomonadales bacterium]